ncbi:thiamine-phosphate kinase [Buchnera aphidicola (Mindarus keteleerifoliae)]|uniref:thiamine-phosphate kinase n=1 Tax=Buchnera aphidicola TaxID=9 RepID=UPI0031B719EC
MIINEFEIINNYFNHFKKKDKYIMKGIGDDCAILKIPKNKFLSVSTDTLVEGIHFLKTINPIDLSYKALAVNLSDLAAMGADPKWLTLSITMPYINLKWIKYFSKNFIKLIYKNKMKLIGGDTTKGPLSITISAYGLIPKGKALFRNGAKVGDLIYVTGTLGNSAAGLELLTKKISITDKKIYNFLIKKHLRPVPRILQGKILRNIATSAIDISDGLIMDLNHILNASKCGATLNLDNFPISKKLKNNFFKKKWINWALYCGEDYELCFTIPKKQKKKLDELMKFSDVPYTHIGNITPFKKGYQLLEFKKPIKLKKIGFNHFF